MQNTQIPHLSQCSLKFHPQLLSRLACALLFALATVGSVAAEVAQPSGPYGFVLNATYSDPSTQGGAALLGLLKIDDAGNITGTYALEIGSGGAVPLQDLDGNLTGSYSSNHDGTGTIILSLDIESDLTLDVVPDNQGRSLQLALTGCTGPVCDLTGTVVSGVCESTGGQSAFDGPVHFFHKRLFSGRYGLQTTKSAPTPQTSIEVWSFDLRGRVKKSGTFVGPDLQVENGTLEGTFSVNPDGTGTITIPPQNGSLMGETWVFVLTDGRSGLFVMQTARSGDGVVYGAGHLQ